MLDKKLNLIDFIEKYREILLKEEKNPRIGNGSLGSIRQDHQLKEINQRLDFYTKDTFLVMHKVNEKEYSSELLIRFPVNKKAFCLKILLKYTDGLLKFTSVKGSQLFGYEDYLSGISEVGFNGNKNLTSFSIRDKKYLSINEAISDGINLAKIHFKKILETPLIVRVNANTKEVINNLEITMASFEDICSELDLAKIKAFDLLINPNPKTNSFIARLDKSGELMEENINYVKTLLLKKGLEAELDQKPSLNNKVKSGFKI